MLWWNAENGWALFAFQGTRRLEGEWTFGTPLLLGCLVLLLTPGVLLGLIEVLLPDRFGGVGLDRGNGSTAVGLARPRRTGSDKRRFAVVFTLVPLSVFLLFSLTHEPKLNWAGPLWLAALPLLAWDMAPARVSEVVPKLKAFGRRTWPATLVLTTLTYGVLLHTTTLGLPFFPPLDKLRLAGNAELGREVQALVLEADSGGTAAHARPPLVVGLDRYRTASLMAFYRPCPDAVEDTTSEQMVGGEGLMYGSWIDADRQAGRTMVLLAEKPDELDRDRVADRFASLGPVRVLEAATPNGGRRRLYGRIGLGYLPEQAVLAGVPTPEPQTVGLW